MKKGTVGKTLLPFLGLAVLVALAGCKDGGPSARIFVKNGQTNRLRIAVLPFDNVSRNQDAGRILTNTVITYLLSTGEFDVVEPGVVYTSLQSEGVRLTEGINREICSKLQPKLNADALIVGMVEEFGEVRIGPDSYPSISFSARLVNARNAEILWAATISKTGADSVKLFDIGRVSSLGKLAKKAVGDMASSLADSRQYILADLEAAPEKESPFMKVEGEEPEVTLATTPASGTAFHGPAKAAPSESPRYLDETAAYDEEDLKGLLQDVGTAKLGPVEYSKHFHDTLQAQYQIGETGKSVEVKLVDYRKAATAEKFIQHYNPGQQQTVFEGLPAFSGETDFSYYHVDVAVGRFGLYLRGHKDTKDAIDALGAGIIALLK